MIELETRSEILIRCKGARERERESERKAGNYSSE
jgi:hypothetical protein